MGALARRTPAVARARQQTEAALLRAADALLAEGTPFADLSIETIARRAGVSRPTFYAYFADKRALALRLGQDLEAAIGESVADWLQSSRGDLRITLDATLGVFIEHRGTLSALVEAATYDDEVAAFWRALHERFAHAARGRLLRDNPDLDAAVADARAFALVWATERCLTEHLFAPRVQGTALMDTLELLWTAALERPDVTR